MVVFPIPDFLFYNRMRRRPWGVSCIFEAESRQRPFCQSIDALMDGRDGEKRRESLVAVFTSR